MKRFILVSVFLALAGNGYAAPPKVKTAPLQVVEISVTKEGFVKAANAPATLRVGQPVKLVVTRLVERTCATDIVVKELGINKPLPLNQKVEVVFTPKKAGKVRYACAMDMIAGEFQVVE